MGIFVIPENLKNCSDLGSRRVFERSKKSENLEKLNSWKDGSLRGIRRDES